MKISQRAFDMTVAEEVSSQAYYTKHYERPEWPGLSSGVTIGIGYDLGQASRAKITADWSGLVSSDMMLVMLSCSGITGKAGKGKCAEVRSRISIPWAVALDVFSKRDVPQWTAAVLKAVPGADKLTPSCLGVLFDTAYNRGVGGFNSTADRFRELVAIRDDVKANRLSSVPAELTAMKRLWPGTKGLLARCDHRVALWKVGMAESGKVVAEAPVGPTPKAPDPDVPLKEGPARTKPPVTSTAQNTTTGAIVAGSLAGAQQAQAAGFSLWNVILIGVLGVVAACVVWLLWYRNRNPS